MSAPESIAQGPRPKKPFGSLFPDLKPGEHYLLLHRQLREFELPPEQLTLRERCYRSGDPHYHGRLQLQVLVDKATGVLYAELHEQGPELLSFLDRALSGGDTSPLAGRPGKAMALHMLGSDYGFAQFDEERLRARQIELVRVVRAADKMKYVMDAWLEDLLHLGRFWERQGERHVEVRTPDMDLDTAAAWVLDHGWAMAFDGKNPPEATVAGLRHPHRSCARRIDIERYFEGVGRTDLHDVMRHRRDLFQPRRRVPRLQTAPAAGPDSRSQSR